MKGPIIYIYMRVCVFTLNYKVTFSNLIVQEEFEDGISLEF